MPLSINTNVASMTAQRAFLNSNNGLETAFERLSTGKRVNSAVDDAAGLAIGTDLDSRVRGLNQAVRNVNDGISTVQIVEGALSEVTSILQRMRDLSVQAASGGLSTTEQSYLDTEQSKLASALDSAIDQAKFGNTDLVSGTASTTVTVQSGADAADRTDIVIDSLSADVLNVQGGNVSLHGYETVEFSGMAIDTDTTADDQWYITLGNVTYKTVAANVDSLSTLVTKLNAADTVGDGSGTALSTLWTITLEESDTKIIATSKTATDVSNDTSALTYGAGSGTDATVATTATVRQDGGTYGIAEIDSALDTVASDRATLGAMQAQLESMVRNLSNVAENTAAATGRIMDTDYAAETANLTKAQILQQAATSILAQANAQPQAVLSLLQ
jgi:flagellin